MLLNNFFQVNNRLLKDFIIKRTIVKKDLEVVKNRFLYKLLFYRIIDIKKYLSLFNITYK